jgi:hypothetical protein
MPNIGTSLGTSATAATSGINPAASVGTDLSAGSSSLQTTTPDAASAATTPGSESSNSGGLGFNIDNLMKVAKLGAGIYGMMNKNKQWNKKFELAKTMANNQVKNANNRLARQEQMNDSFFARTKGKVNHPEKKYDYA